MKEVMTCPQCGYTGKLQPDFRCPRCSYRLIDLMKCKGNCKKCSDSETC